MKRSLAHTIADKCEQLGINLINRGDKAKFTIRRTRAGRHQRSCGAWSFTLDDEYGCTVTGSFDTAKEIAAAKEIEFYKDGYTQDLTISVKVK